MTGFGKFIVATTLFTVSLAYITNEATQSKWSSKRDADQVWDYVKVRDDAYMFWWLYFTTATPQYTERPLVMWLQGGPGGSSTGFGNFEEIGPLDINLNPRNTTWLQSASVLFVDNPVGTGFSYVTDDGAYSTDSHQIAVDLLTTMKAFLKNFPKFQNVPFYIFSESYGGKMTAAFAQELHNAIVNKELVCNFQGFAMGDSWISPVDSVMSWAPYLYATSLVDSVGYANVSQVALQCQRAVKDGRWKEATDLWDTLEALVGEVTAGVNWYNILKWDSAEVTTNQHKVESQFQRHVSVYQTQDLDSLMNGPIRQKLKIIPSKVKWGGQSAAVFTALRADFMKDVVPTVENLLKTKLKVVVYSGQLDLIVDTMGTEQWVQGLDWAGLAAYNSSTRDVWYTSSHSRAGYVKQYHNFSFYWLLQAGHMVPQDQGEAALTMLNKIIH